MESQFERLKIKNTSLDEIVICRKKRDFQSELKLRDQHDAVNILRKIYGDEINSREMFVVLLINSRNRVAGYYEVSKGGVSSTVVDVRLILSLCMKLNTWGIIISHNHPSGNTNPSGSDLDLTDDLIMKGKGVYNILDHLIITQEGYYSFNEQGDLSGFNTGYNVLPENSALIYEPSIKPSMITVRNIVSEYPKIAQKELPVNLRQATFSEIEQMIDFYGQNQKIDAAVDMFIAELNSVIKISKPTKSIKPAKTGKTATKAVVPKKTTKAKRDKKTAKPKPAPKKNADKPKKPERTKVSQNEMWFIVLRKFVNYVGKPIRTKTLYDYAKHFQRDFQANPGRPKTPNIKHIRFIQDVLLKQVNRNLKADFITIKIPEFQLKRLQNIVNAHKLDRTINKRKLASKPLSGTSIDKTGILSSNDLVKMNFKTLNFTGDWKKLIGKPTLPFHVMFYGRGGSGKSTAVIQFAHYLADKFRMKVLFVAKEEGQSGTTKGKFLRLKANHANIDISESIPTGRILSRYDVVVLDSVNELAMSPNDIRALQQKHPNLSTVQIFKVTKQGKFMGQNDFQHLVQAEFVIEDGEIHSEKNRFGGTETIKVNFGN